ncbi:UbiA family prenyltransferase [Modestobacter versicolor]|uniref:4-hydroxybenzoate polyprenyltransferase n=1 Tax=Modestobacter versicolor TaxID=429133 RepID=A0A839Y3D0_9ACTN|nr:UbiA family prenyltransferase [Modestobacter versicolor]MBB3675872.1 4-hydroxybenzoate polyprenyltransferase [Modestobacter versicolor]
MSVVQRTPLPVTALLWAETRPVVQAIFAVRYWVGALVVLAGGGAFGPAVVLGSLGWLLLTMSIYLVNGVSDLTADRANGSDRPLARGLIGAHGAVRVAWALAAASLLLTALTGTLALVLCAVAMGVLGWAYSVGPHPLKNSVAGTAVASAGGGLLTYLAGAAAAGGLPDGPYVAVFVLLALWMAVAGAAKDLGDRSGDEAAGRRTLPVVAGHRAATRVIAAGCLALGTTTVVVAGTWPEVLLPALVLCLGAVVVAVLALRTREDLPRALVRRPYRAFMVTQYAVNPALLLSVLV